MAHLCFENLEARRLFTIAGTTLGAYHTYATLTADLKAYAKAYPLLTQLISIGKSIQNRELWALKITDHPTLQEDEPELRYIGAMHGDEPVGMENTLYFATKLLEGYGQDPRVTKMVDNTEIWLIPNLNPDGLMLDQRVNANDQDLNRSFPEGSTEDIGDIFDGPALDTTDREPEVAAMMKFSAANSFTASINFHTGSTLANYPYDSNNNGYPDDAPTPDDAMWKQLALTYSRQNPTMYKSWEFPQGISNGDNWYEVYGGLQDWSYRYLGDNDMTVELSDIKKPEESKLPKLWQENSESMMQYAEAINWGVRGVVTRSTDGAPVYAKVKVQGNSHLVFTDPDVGDFHRMLLPGKYSFTFTAPGYESKTVKDVVVTEKTTDASLTTRLNVTLVPEDQTPPAVLAASFAYSNNPPSLNFRFDDNVGASVNPGDVQILNEAGKVIETAITSSWNADTKTASFSFSPKALRDGNYRVRLLASRIRDAMGNPLASDQKLNFYIFTGDANRDRKVDKSDSDILASNFGLAGNFSQGDFNYSGVIESRDFNLLLSRYGKQLNSPVSVAIVGPPAPGVFSDSSWQPGLGVLDGLL